MRNILRQKITNRGILTKIIIKLVSEMKLEMRSHQILYRKQRHKNGNIIISNINMITLKIITL